MKTHLILLTAYLLLLIALLATVLALFSNEAQIANFITR